MVRVLKNAQVNSRNCVTVLVCSKQKVPEKGQRRVAEDLRGLEISWRALLELVMLEIDKAEFSGFESPIVASGNQVGLLAVHHALHFRKRRILFEFISILEVAR